MIFLFLLLLSSSHLYAIITKGYSFTSPAHSNVKMIGDKHPSIDHKPDQNKVKNQLAVLNAFLQCQSQQNTVVLAEEISPSLAKYIKADNAFILRDMRILAKRYGVKYENIDLRGATLAAGYVIKKDEPINKTLSFGPTQDALKTPSLVTLDDLFEEKERYIGHIRGRFSWSRKEQKQLNVFSRALSNTLQGWDWDITVDTFCRNTSPEVKNEVYKKIYDMRMYLFDNYAKKVVMDYSQDHTVLLAAGFDHIQNVKDQLVTEHGWQDYRVHYNGDVLTDYNLKSTLGITTWWDHTKNCFGCAS